MKISWFFFGYFLQIRNHERQARHLRGDQLRQDQVKEDGDAGEEPPADERK